MKKTSVKKTKAFIYIIYNKKNQRDFKTQSAVERLVAIGTS